jgi:hypothetical protein
MARRGASLHECTMVVGRQVAVKAKKSRAKLMDGWMEATLFMIELGMIACEMHLCKPQEGRPVHGNARVKETNERMGPLRRQATALPLTLLLLLLSPKL